MDERELKILERAIEYTSSLSRGVNPLDNHRLPDADVVNEPKVRAYLEYVEQVLRKYRYDQLNPTVLVKGSVPFYVTNEQLKNYVFSEEPITATAFCRKVTALAENPAMAMMKAVDVSAWLMQEGYLQETEYQGRPARTPSAKGRENGIYAYEAINQDNEKYIRVTYGPKAQLLLLRNISKVIGSYERNKPAKTENQ